MKSKASGKKAVSSKSEVRIDGRVSVSQVEKAITALVKHREKTHQSNDELPMDGEEDLEGEGSRMNRSDVVWMQMTVKRLNANAPIKAVRIFLPHAVWPKSSSVCLLTADPQRRYKDLMVEEKLTQVKRVVGVTKLKGKFRPFEARRQLMNDHDVFLADDRIITMLPKLLGKKWVDDRKSPIPVKLTRTNNGHLSKEINMALASTQFYRNKGTCSSVRVGSLTHLSPGEITENIVASLPNIVAKHVKGGWENVQSIDIKTGSSVALPVWNSKLDERWIGMPQPVADGESDEENDSEIEEDIVEKEKSIKDKVSTKKSKTVEAPVEGKVRSSISKEVAGPKISKKTKKTA